jgi:hypothetical protein
MSDATSTAKPGIAHMPPEGEHFAIEEDAERLRLVIRSKPAWGMTLLLIVCAVAWTVIPIGYVAASAPGTSWLITALLAVLPALFAFASVTMVLDNLFGREALVVSGEHIIIETRALVVWRRGKLARTECCNLRVLPRRHESNDRPMLYNGSEYGRIGFDTASGMVRLGAQLSDEDAAAICAFLLERCPDLGPRAKSLAVPDGEHFMLDDDGERIRLIIRPRRDIGIPIKIGIVGVVAGFAAVFAQMRGGLFSDGIATMAWIAAAVASAAALYKTLEQWFGYEMLTVTKELVRVETRIVLPLRGREVPRAECHGLAIAQPAGTSDNPPGLLSCGFGRVSLEYGERRVRLGATLTETEAAAIVGFLLSRCPGLGARGGVTRAGT